MRQQPRIEVFTEGPYTRRTRNHPAGVSFGGFMTEIITGHISPTGQSCDGEIRSTMRGGLGMDFWEANTHRCSKCDQEFSPNYMREMTKIWDAQRERERKISGTPLQTVEVIQRNGCIFYGSDPSLI